MAAENLKKRLKAYALQIIHLYSDLPKENTVAQVIGKQMLRSGTSAGAQQREADYARSPAEFISKMNSALQELGETEYWLELLLDSCVISKEKLDPLLKENGELKAIFITIVVKAKKGAQS